MKVDLLSAGDPTQRTGGYLYNARLVQALGARGHDVVVHAVQGDWPLGPAKAAVPVRPGAVVLADGLLWTGLGPTAFGPRTVVIVHSPLGAEGGEALGRREAAALRDVGAVVSTGGPTQRDLTALGVPSVCVVPGTDPAPCVERPRQGRLLALGTVTPRKGLPRLLAALQAVTAPWSLVVAGSLTRDAGEVARVRAVAGPFGDRVQFVGELDDEGVERALASADLLVHTAHYEAYGMVLAEAMARGVAVLCTPAGAAEAGGCEVVHADGLGAALQRLLSEPDALDALSQRSRDAGARLPTWADVAARFETLMLPLEAR